jgi:hypothetical protein
MSFLGQFNFGYPVISQNLIKTIPDNAVLPLSIGSSLKGNILGTTFGDLKAQINPEFINRVITYGEDLFYTNNGVTPIGSSESVLIGANSCVATENLIGSVVIGNDIATMGGSCSNNTLIGHRAGNGNPGANNTVIGAYAHSLRGGFSGSNIVIGRSVGNDLQNVTTNIIIGANGAGNSMQDSGDNVVIGNFTGRQLRSNSNRNVFIGEYSGGDTQIKTGVTYNVAIGSITLQSITTGVNNVVVGSLAAANLTTGSGNVILGFQANTANNSQHCVVLGRAASATGNNQFVVGSPSYPVGTITNAAAAQTHYWTVRINGTDYKILLAV